jgi:Ca-activated chloride channel homolog
MRISYSEWKPGESSTAEDRLKQLLELFSQILLQTSGDVQETLEWMGYLDEQYHIFGPDMTLDMFIDKLKELGLVREDEDALLKPTNKAIQNIRRDALLEMFRSLRKSPTGAHDTPHTGSGIERTQNTKGYTFGDQSSNIDFTQTFQNAQKRAFREQLDDDRVHDADLNLREEDIEVYETEHLTSCATVLMIDISHSMILYGEDRFTPAKKVAMALSHLLRTQYPGDSLSLILFHDSAEEIPLSQLARVKVGPYYTNTREGLRLAQRILQRQRKDMKQIVMITDGKPSALTLEDGRIYKNAFGLDPLVVSQTLEEVSKCKRAGVMINTFMLASDYGLVQFVQKVTEMCRGKAYFTTPYTLGQYLLMDYMSRKTKTIH